MAHEVRVPFLDVETATGERARFFDGCTRFRGRVANSARLWAYVPHLAHLQMLSGMLTPETREKFLGNAEILEVFNISKVGKVAGCKVTEGIMRRGGKVRLIRDNVVIHEGDLSTLKRFKDEVKEVQSGQECGMAFTNYQDMQKGDVIECFEVETIQRAL